MKELRIRLLLDLALRTDLPAPSKGRKGGKSLVVLVFLASSWKMLCERHGSVLLCSGSQLLDGSGEQRRGCSLLLQTSQWNDYINTERLVGKQQE